MRDENEVHPIAKLALSLLKKEGRALTLGTEGKSRLMRSLTAITGRVEKKNALRELVCFAWFLEHKKHSPHASREVLDVIEAASGDLAASGESLHVDGEVLQASAKRFQKMMGDKTGSSAPKLGDEAAEGTVKAGTLGPRRRL